MIRRNSLWSKLTSLALVVSAACWADPVGRVVAIGGHGADLALDEARGVLYVANFTANRIDVVSLASHTVQTSLNVASQPGSISLSPDGRFLLVAHYGNFERPASSANALTLIELETGSRQRLVMADPPMAVAFGGDGKALVLTNKEFLLFDPETVTNTRLTTVESVVAKTLPVPPANFPLQITTAAMGVSGDGQIIYGQTDTVEFRYDVAARVVDWGRYASSPTMGPRVVSVNRDGTVYTSGWTVADQYGYNISQFANVSGALNVGTTLLDTARGLIYAQIPEAGAGTATTPRPPILQIAAADNLAVQERLQLPENLAGKSILSADGATMYALSDSGVVVLPIGRLHQVPRVRANQEDLVFRGNFCDRRVATRELTIEDPGGGNVPFSLISNTPGVSISPASGITPVTVRVSVDPNAFQNQKGTVAAAIEIRSQRAVNLPEPVRLLINSREPDQQGTFINVPGRLIDLIADPMRDRYYVLRQDRNQVLVFNAANNTQIGTLRTGNTPTSMALSFDRRHLLIGADNAQFILVYDLDTLQPTQPVRVFNGDYVRSLAVSGNAILAAVRNASGGDPNIHRVDLEERRTVRLPSLGVYQNKVALDTALVATPNGSAIMAVQADGSVMLYNASADTFTVSRKDFSALSGSYAASNLNQFVVGNTLLNSSLVPVRTLGDATGSSSGFAFLDQVAFRTTSPAASSPGVIQRVNVATGEGIRATRMVEAPVIGDTGRTVFTRTLAPLAHRDMIVSLSVSGLTVLPWNYDAAIAPPRIERIVNAADLTQPIAPGGLVSLFGRDLSPVNLASRQTPLPTALGESCLTANGVPVPMVFVSPGQINGQLPFPVDGSVTMVLRTPGGVSDNFNLTILPAAPSIFRSRIEGESEAVPQIIRERNREVVTAANPVRGTDRLSIFLTGMGRTTPAVESGFPAPSEPVAVPLVPPTVTLAGVELPVDFSGLVPGQVGVYQINVSVPYWVPAGMNQTLRITQGGFATSVQVRVVN